MEEGRGRRVADAVAGGGLKDRGLRSQAASSTAASSPAGSPRAAAAKQHSAPFGAAPAPGKSPSVDRLAGPAAPPRLQSHAALLSMALLTLQCTAVSIVLRYSRVAKGRKYLPSVAVLLSEVGKLALCTATQLYRSRRAAPPAAPAAPSRVASGVALAADEALRGGGKDAAPLLPAFQPPPLPPPGRRGAGRAAAAAAQLRHAAPMALPAAMFVGQQVLLILAATHLDAVTYQIFNQAFKLIPTALFAYWLLGQQLERIQWASIPVLSLGVVFVTVNTSTAAVAAPGSAVGSPDWLLGMAACSASGLSSAFAGVYFERYVKGRLAASLWVRNIQLGAFGVPFSAAYAWARDGPAIRRHGWLQGFSPAAWAVVALQIFGGLVTGAVVKYCDNVLKNFALAVSVILTVLVAIPLFGQWPSAFFLVGVTLTLLSVAMYGRVIERGKVAQWVAASRKVWGERRGRQRRGAAVACGVATLLLLGAASSYRARQGLATTAGLRQRPGAAQQLKPGGLARAARAKQRGGG